jgi:hypothetical protein
MRPAEDIWSSLMWIALFSIATAAAIGLTVAAMLVQPKNDGEIAHF